MKIRYLSLFSGIGGFEYAIHSKFKDAECLGFSEVKAAALRVYTHHYPAHHNLGDVTKITDKQLNAIVRKGCNLIVAGFPCTNLTSLSHITGTNQGLKGAQSGLFYNLLYILKYVLERRKRCKFIIENNASMSKANKELITSLLREACPSVCVTMLNAATFGVQARRRLFWTNFEVDTRLLPTQPIQTYDDVLEPVASVKKYICKDDKVSFLNRLYETNRRSDVLITIEKTDTKWKFAYTPTTPENAHRLSRLQIFQKFSDNSTTHKGLHNQLGKSVPMYGDTSLLLDRRACECGTFVVRKLTLLEKERLFFFPDHYVEPYVNSYSEGSVLLSNSIVTACISFIIEQMM